MPEQDQLHNIDTTIYANRWIAIVRGHVAGVGLTAGQAYRTAKHTNPKRRPQLMFIDTQGKRVIGKEWLNRHPLLQKITKILQTQQIEAYLVGGAVRDMLLDEATITDLDFVVPSDGLKVARRVANILEDAYYYPLDETRGIGRVICSDDDHSYLDFSTYRGDDLLSDLIGRDFTINAIALSLTDPPELIDPCQGQVDLQMKRLQAVSETAMRNDPIRVLRAVRMAIRFDCAIESFTKQLITAAAPLLLLASPERQRDELIKLLNTPAPGRAVQMLHELEILPHVLPEVAEMVGVEQSAPHHLDVFEHTVATLNTWSNIKLEGELSHPLKQWRDDVKDYLAESVAGHLTQQDLLPIALLLHDTGKPATQSKDNDRIRFLGHETESAKIVRQVMGRFRFSGQATSFVEKIVVNHMRPLTLAQQGKVSRRAIYRLFRDSSGAALEAGPAVVLHAIADHYGTYPPGEGQEAEDDLMKVVNRLLQAYFEQRDKVISPPLLLTGHDLISQFGIKEGKLIGQLLRQLKEAQAVGTVSTKEEALEFVEKEKLVAENNLSTEG
jgi:putative nucleotidyltransferase with HDIG domain